MKKSQLVKILRGLADTLERDDVRIQNAEFNAAAGSEPSPQFPGDFIEKYIRTGEFDVNLSLSYEVRGMRAKDIEKALSE